MVGIFLSKFWNTFLNGHLAMIDGLLEVIFFLIREFV